MSKTLPKFSLSMRIQMIAIGRIKGAVYNPRNRVERAKIKSLVRSITQFGLGYPLKITADMRLIDGHRRLAALKELGYKRVPVIVSNHVPSAAMYREITTEVRKHNGPERLEVYLIEPLAVPVFYAKKAERYTNYFGRELLEKICKQGKSIDVIDWAIYAAKYLGLYSNYTSETQTEAHKVTAKIVNWIMKHKANNYIRKHCSLDLGQNRLFTMIANDRAPELS